MRRVAIVVVLTLLGVAAWHWHRLAWIAGLVPARNMHGTIVFVVLDTVRADRTSLCGYSRETTPTLRALAADGATYTCRAYAPGTWTVPSHASFFTGQTVVEHGAHELPTKAVCNAPATEVPCEPLGTAQPTLAEALRADGHRTVMISQNPVVSSVIGLTRGFEYARTSTKWHAWTGSAWPDLIEQVLRRTIAGDDEKLFLFLNIAEAHGPWWESRPNEPFHGRSLFYNPRNPSNVWRQWYGGKMTASARTFLLRRLDVAYDLGVWRADQALKLALDRLRALGVCGDDCRVVVTADHGEMLGEHGAIDHGFVPWEGNQRVPMLVAGPGAPAIPEPISGAEVFDVVRTGAFPAERKPIEAVFWPHAERWEHSEHAAYGGRGAMWWSGTTKWVWSEGTWLRYELDTDPAELNPLGGVPPEPAKALADAVAAVPDAIGSDARVNELLEAAGYVE